MHKKSELEKLIRKHQKKLNKAIRKYRRKVEVKKEPEFFCACCVKQMKKGD